jgi:FHA domain
MLILIVAEGPDKGRIYEWTDDQTVIVGRESKDVRLSDGKASRQHARFKCEGGKWYVRDLASRHGTLVNKIRIEGKTPLNDGDRVQIARTQLVVARVPAEQAERVALIGGQPAGDQAWQGIPAYRRFIPRASTAAAMTAAAFAVACSVWLYVNTTDANLKLREDLIASQAGMTEDLTKSQLAATEAQTQATRAQLAMADRTDEVLGEVRALGTSSAPMLDEILASIQAQGGDIEQLGEIREALAELQNTSQPTLDAILARVESQSSQWMTLAEVRGVIMRQQTDTASLLPQLEALAMATRANEQSLDALRQSIEKVQASPDLDAKVLDQLEATVAELRARPTLDQIAEGVRLALAKEQGKTDALLGQIEVRLSASPDAQDLIAPLREALTSQAQATEQLVSEAFDQQRTQTDGQIAELRTLIQSQSGEAASALREVVDQLDDHGDLNAVLASVRQLQSGSTDAESMALLRELTRKLETAPTTEQLAEAVADVVTDQLDSTRPLMEQIASSLDESARQDEVGQTLLEQVRVALLAQQENDARLDQIYDLLASSEGGTDSEALRQVLREIRTKSIAGMDELRSTIRREVKAGLTEQRLAVARDLQPVAPVALGRPSEVEYVAAPSEQAAPVSEAHSADSVTMAAPHGRDIIQAQQDTPVVGNALTDVEQAYRLAFKTGKPITLGGGSIDAETGKVIAGRTLDPSAAKAAGITDWRDWYLMDDFAERMRLQQQAVKYHNGRRGTGIIGIPESAVDTTDSNSGGRGSGG